MDRNPVGGREETAVELEGDVTSGVTSAFRTC